MKLEQFFVENNRMAIAFSGGADSAYLLYAAIQSGAKVKAYYVKTAFQPQFELEDALRLAQELHADISVLTLDILAEQTIALNGPDRCYYCKKNMFTAMIKAACEDGFSLLIDGTNASDDADDRPGMRAIKELSVRSPLRECGLTKQQIRALSQEAGLFTWNKPAYACLATRIPTGTPITWEMLKKTEQAEDYLSGLGFSDFRVRMLGDGAKLQFLADQLEKVIADRDQIVGELKKYYSSVLLDLEVRK